MPSVLESVLLNLQCFVMKQAAHSSSMHSSVTHYDRISTPGLSLPTHSSNVSKLLSQSRMALLLFTCPWEGDSSLG